MGKSKTLVTKRRELLERSAKILIDAEVIRYANSVVLLEYDDSSKTNRFVTLFGDWGQMNEHAAAKDPGLWQDSTEKLRDALKDLVDSQSIPESLGRIMELMSDWPQRDKQLKLAGELLKNAIFYWPLTTHLAEEAGCATIPFAAAQFNFLKKIPEVSSQRRDAEQQNGKQGHWQYGIPLERFYCTSHLDDFFAAYFVKEASTDKVLAIGAPFPSRRAAMKMQLLNHVVPLLRDYQKNPFSQKNTSTKSPIRKLTPFNEIAGPIPSSSEDDRRRWLDCDKEYHGLRSDNLNDFLKIVADIRKQTNHRIVALEKLEEALLSVSHR